MNMASEDIKDILVSEPSFDLVFAENLFIGKEPTSPNNTVTIFDVSGAAPMLTYTRGENYYYTDIQIRVRNESYKEAWETSQIISEFLHGKEETINDTIYTLIQAMDSPFFLGWDDNDRARFVVNYGLQRRPEGE